MIATTVSFWKAFFDPSHPLHAKARGEIRLFDRDKVILSEFVIAEVCSWLIERGKIRQKNWFLDYAENTSNARIFLFGKEEFAEIVKIAILENLTMDKASLEYLRRRLKVDITGY
ncbi:MAG TPA: hypothetical protein VLD37_03870 [Candidatus Bilamarchaeum sp.]|nr:hypothetical protein [Candidatus Bilamarchaeum sp.]